MNLGIMFVDALRTDPSLSTKLRGLALNAMWNFANFVCSQMSVNYARPPLS